MYSLDSLGWLSKIWVRGMEVSLNKYVQATINLFIQPAQEDFFSQ